MRYIRELQGLIDEYEQTNGRRPAYAVVDRNTFFALRQDLNWLRLGSGKVTILDVEIVVIPSSGLLMLVVGHPFDKVSEPPSAPAGSHLSTSTSARSNH